MSGGTASIAGQTLNITGLTTISGQLNFTSTGGTKTFSNLTITSGGRIHSTASETYTINGTLNMSGGTISAALGTSEVYQVNGDMNILAGTSTIGIGDVTVTGTTTVSGTLTWGSKAGTKILNNVIINSGGYFNNTSNEAFRINGNFQVDGTIDSGNKNFVFAGTGKTISGSAPFTIERMNVTGSVTNNGQLTVSNRLVGAGTFSQGSTGTLNFSGGIFSVTTFNASTSANLVNFNTGGTFSIPVPADGSYHHLTVTGGTYVPAADLTIRGNLSIPTGTTLNCQSTDITLGGNFTNNGTFSFNAPNILLLNGTSAQNIGGTTTTAFNSVNITNTSAPVTASSSFTASGTFTVGSAATFSPAAAVLISGTGTLTGSGTVQVTRILSVADFLTQYPIAIKTLGGLTVDYIGAGAQNVNALNYGSLTISTNGTRTVTFPAAVVRVSRVFSPSLLTTNYVVTGNTVEFNGTIAQNIPAFNYNNLSSSSVGARTLSATGTVGVAGTFTPSTNAYTVTGSTVNYNGTGAQTITAFNYNNLSSTLTGARTLPSTGIVGVAGVFSPGTNSYTITGSTVNFNGTIAQTIPAFNFNNLTSSSSGTRTLASTGTIGVAGIFTPGSNSYTTDGSTVNFNGSAAQIIPAFNYFNLTSSLAGARTLQSSGIIGVAGAFTPGTNTYTVTGSTVNYNGSSAQNVTAFNYFNLNSTSTGTRTLPAVGTVGIAGSFVPGTNSYTTINSTVSFNGTTAQTIPNFSYHHLQAAGSGIKSLSGNIAIDGNLSISSTLDVSTSNHQIDLKGNWIKTGTFISQDGTVRFNGSAPQTLTGSGSTDFENIDVANSTTVSLVSGSYSVAGALLMTQGNFNTGGQQMTLLSDAGKTARIGQLGAGASISGSFTIQRFLTTRLQSPTTSHWSDLASPVQSSTMADWDAELFLSYTHSPPDNYSNVVAFSESLDDYYGVSAGTTLSPGQGFEIALTDDASLTTFTNTTLTSVGVPDQGDQNLSSLISYTSSGTNLVGNPFASSISWNTVLASSSGILSTYDVYDCNAASYATFGAGSEIGAGQGFWVYTTTPAATLIVPEAAKTSSTNSTIKAPSNDRYVLVKLETADEQSYSHTMKILLSDAASSGWDDLEHPYRASPCKDAPGIFSPVGERKAVILSTPAEDELEIPLSLSAGHSGKFQLSFDGLLYAEQYECALLEDRLSNHWTDIRKSSSVQILLGTGVTANRYFLHFSRQGKCETRDQSLPAGVIVAEQSGQTNLIFSCSPRVVTVTVTNILGQEIVPSERINTTSESHLVPIPESFQGACVIRVTGDGLDFSQKLIK
jgi:hypothetical protein